MKSVRNVGARTQSFFMTERIYLSGNDLTGKVPSEITRLTNLGTFIRITRDKVMDSALTFSTFHSQFQSQ